MASDIGCVVLAAGLSERLGRPKALIRVGGGNLIGWLVSRFQARGLEPLVVTNGDIIEEVTDSVDCRVIVNPEPEAGRTGTLQVGISHLESNIRQRVLVTDSNLQSPCLMLTPSTDQTPSLHSSILRSPLLR